MPFWHCFFRGVGRQDMKGAGADCSSKPAGGYFVCLVSRAPLLDGNTIGNWSHTFKIQNRLPCSVCPTSQPAWLRGWERGRKLTFLCFLSFSSGARPSFKRMISPGKQNFPGVKALPGSGKNQQEAVLCLPLPRWTQSSPLFPLS